KTAVHMPFFHPLSLINNNRGVFGVNLGRLWHEPEKAATWMRSILQGVEAGWISPHVDTTFSFEEAGEAHRYIEERKNRSEEHTSELQSRFDLVCRLL